MPISFEEALKRLQAAEGLPNRGAALDRLFAAHKAGDPELSNISDLNSSLVSERAKSIAERAGIGAFEGVEVPVEEILGAGAKLFGYQPGPTLGETAAEAVRRQTVTTPYAEGVGEIAGSALPFTALEKGAALLPLIGRSGIVRQIVAGSILERADTGRNTVLGSVVAPVVLPKVVEMAAGLVATGARRLFGRGADVIPEAASFDKPIEVPKAVIGVTKAPETPPLALPPPETVYGEGFTMRPSPLPQPPEATAGEVAPPEPTPESNLEAAHRTLFGRGGGPSETSETLRAASSVFGAPPETQTKPGFEKTAEDLLAEREAESQIVVGTANLRTGQPFEGTRTIQLEANRGRVFVNADHPNAELGTPKSVTLANPAVFNVHDNPYKDVLETVFEKQPRIVEGFNQAETPEEYSREMLGRWAKANKYDSVVLRAPDPKNDIILDFKDFKASKHPNIGQGMSANIAAPPKSVFARKAARELDPRVHTAEIVRGDPVETSVIKDPETGQYYGLSTMTKSLKDYKPETIDRALRERLDFELRRRGGFAQKSDEIIEQFKREGRQLIDETQRRVDEFKKSSDLNIQAQGYGFNSAKHMATAIRTANHTPFEMYKFGAKAQGMSVPPIESPMGVKTLAEFREFNPEYADALEAVANRRPWLMNKVSKILIGNLGPKYTDTFAVTYMDKDGNIIMGLNTPMMHIFRGAPHYGADPRENYVTTLEHELTHVAQYWADVKGLSKALNVPSMDEGGGDVYHPVERQAYERDYTMREFFNDQRRLKSLVDRIPDDVKQQVLAADIDNNRLQMKPLVRRKYNKLKGQPTTIVWAQKVPGLDPWDMDAFDSDSRSLHDGEFDPDKLISPEVKEFLDLANRYGLKWFPSFRRPSAVSDHPAHLSFISRIYEMSRGREISTRRMNSQMAKILKEYGATDKNYDNLFDAVEGLRRLPDGKLVQTKTGFDAKTLRAAEQFREHVSDPLFELITGIDRRAPAILREENLEDTPKSWWRIKFLQQGLTDKVNKPTMGEVNAANRMQGMLNFDESHDLRGGFVDGYITHQPIKNEKAQLLDDIRQLQLTQSDPQAVALMKDKIKRLEAIEEAMVAQRIKGLPARDVIPKNHFFGPYNVRNEPRAGEVLVDKDVSHIAGRYINGAINKRFFDQALHEFRKVADILPPSVRDYDTNYLNNLRGVRGYREDIGLVNFINQFNSGLKKLGFGVNRQITLSDVRGATLWSMQMNNFLKLWLNQVRFPIIQASHVGLTSFVVDPAATTKGIAYVLAKPKQAMLEAMAKGIIERDDSFIGAMDEVSPSTQGQMLKYATAMSKYSDYFRKAVTYHGFRLRAMEPGFKPSPVIRTFIKDVAGRNAIQMARDYGAAATDVLQFRLRAEGKPQAFVGGAARRLWGQFKQWPINIGGLYADIIKSGDKKMMARMAGVLWFFGGMSFGGGEMLYNATRREMIKRGYVLPEKTGWQMLLNQTGIGESLQDVNILSLKDPIGLPREWQDIPSWIAGPVFGSMYDYGNNILREGGSPAQAVKATISGISPQLRAGVDAWQELKHGGVVDPNGRVLAMREPSAMVIRGLDLSPSVRTQRYQVKNDIITALEAGQRETAMQLLADARHKGLVFGPKDIAEIKAKVHTEQRQRALFGRGTVLERAERYLQ